MKARKIMVLCAIILCFALLVPVASHFSKQQLTTPAVAVSERIVTRMTVQNAQAAFEATEVIYSNLIEIVGEEIESFDSPDDSDEFFVEEATEALMELNEYVQTLEDLLASIKDLNANADTPDGLTVLAVREYMTLLINISKDLSELVEYSIELYKALIAFDELGEDFSSYEEIAEAIYYASSNSLSMLENITAPAYLSITHNDLILRFEELEDFCVDFYIAAELDDPLRLYSCFSRMNRIEMQINRCADNLDDDLQLQFNQAERRLMGQVTTLRNELKSNIATLLSALGG
ncbi:MAG: hypothetical protein FWG88_09840 [Oscillospiraceae bacterium]|nr:hypothetical protein [Oscillospiraceae bacterium]